ncbi:LysR family transcriptional regulator [Streptomyces alfalfae]|uniref:LysR family transcriptional regulator n=1 Tax=Streptomyces alfalfae TaxID=1642299 RepID=A0A1P8TAX2_9ACTN|nr:LysR family transcriptional regulator [Streptomyces alfalfae]AYA15091.1 LysR family transcriptional regulator [Streptomyces fradiae]APY84777.1 LysR family transcriptional regulator [Streptomyces alfalfae]QQC93103.1 LysR family transcriptional regulator [Streptomyces alfalfae]RXX47213.1 LysR family transcriptional regulator [Streptomyces alfalfae]RZM85971.1 LysR family transcriptional regulator [Streptomyces alfalfae]
MFDLHRLRLLRELKHRGTLAAVASALSYAPSSVSQQLSQLEAEVGVPLLEPVGRRVRLTEQAEILVAHTEAVLARLERAEAEIAASLTDLAGTLRVASFQTAALALIPAALGLLRDQHPRLRVHVTHMEPENALPALQARDFDLVLAEEYPGSPHPRPAELEQADLLDDHLRLALPLAPRGTAGGADADGPMTALRSLADHPWVMEPEGTAARHWAMTLCRDAGFEPDVRFETTDILLHLRLVEEAHAAAFLPDLVWGRRAPSVTLRHLPRGRRTRRISTVVRRGRGRHPAILACRDALLRAAALPPGGAPT